MLPKRNKKQQCFTKERFYTSDSHSFFCLSYGNTQQSKKMPQKWNKARAKKDLFLSQRSNPSTHGDELCHISFHPQRRFFITQSKKKSKGKMVTFKKLYFIVMATDVLKIKK